ncbi:hypothetical protein [Algoriphagus confluentis]|uniref:Lipocalin-like domain-containing protein n=1 Tax=Algoriphagus confluentis TaxID=1697556 RepID=A0ABQ6PRN6_9BACT|nr:hypothetical protein Aconfl_32820 [Algoriphagus confluentis]
MKYLIDCPKFYLILVIGVLVTLSSLAQETNESPKEKIGEKLFGIWRIDFAEQQKNLDEESRSKLSQMEEKEREDFWMTADSRIYLFERDGSYLTTYVEEGVYTEQKGTWSFEENQMILTLEEKEGNRQYRINFTGRGMMWNPIVKDKDFFEVIFLNPLN